MRLLFVASEIYPLAKTGGLADVCAALPVAVARLGADVRLVMPGYPQALAHVVAPRIAADLGEVLPGARVRIIAGRTEDSGLPIWLVECAALYDRVGSPYQDANGADWGDNALRFAVLCHAAARLACDEAGLGWRADVVHANDWHAGLLPLLLRARSAERPKTVFTVHNAAFQGNFPLAGAARLGLPGDVLVPDGIEFFGQLSFLKAGVRYADKVTTVSPTYAREIRTPEFGCGLEGLFDARGDDLTGIMNGIDAQVWNPAADRYLPSRYSRHDMAGKRACKTAVQQALALRIDADAPLALFLSRLTSQKMADVLLAQLPGIMQRFPQLQFALHGQGEHALEAGFARLAQDYPGRMAVRIGYEEAQAHRLHGGADLLLHGSRFEPCGLTQLYAMRYGTIPVVRRVGGLADSVLDADAEAAAGSADATGFTFDEPTAEAVDAALSRCLDVYGNHPETWTALQQRGMSADFGWGPSARRYASLYAALAPARSMPGRVAPDERAPAQTTVQTTTQTAVPATARRHFASPVSQRGTSCSPSCRE